MTTDQILDMVPDLPPAPITACKLVQLLGRPALDNLEEVVQTIEFDASLTARLLRTCNSAFMSGYERVHSVEGAVLRLGYAEIFSLVMALSAKSSLSRDLPAYGFEAVELWAHSVTAALTAQKIAELVRNQNAPTSTAFTAGLLHDIGKTVLSQIALPQIDLIRRMVQSQETSLLEAETAVLGFNHAQVGGALLKRWKLPDPLIEGVANHHAPPVDHGIALSGIVHLANGSAHFAGSSFGWESFAMDLNPAIIDLLGLTPDFMQRIMIFIQGESARIHKFMAID